MSMRWDLPPAKRCKESGGECKYFCRNSGVGTKNKVNELNNSNVQLISKVKCLKTKNLNCTESYELNLSYTMNPNKSFRINGISQVSQTPGYFLESKKPQQKNEIVQLTKTQAVDSNGFTDTPQKLYHSVTAKSLKEKDLRYQK